MTADVPINPFYVKKLKAWRSSALQFVQDCIKITPTKQQLDLLANVAKERRVTVRSGHGCGKDGIVACIAQWFLSTRPYSKVVVTAPTNRQLRDIFLAEFSKWLRHSSVAGDFVVQKDTVFHKHAQKEWWLRLVSPSVRSSKAEQAETLAGFHGDNLMFIVDEACHDDQTEVLTENGFKLFADVLPSDRVLTMNPNTHEVEYVYPTEYHKYNYEGNLYYYDSDNLNFAVTPNHKMYFNTRKSKEYRLTPIKDIGKTRLSTPKGFKWKGDNLDTFSSYDLCRAGWREFPMVPWLAFLGLVVSEGSFVKGSDGTLYGVSISQTNSQGRFVIETVLQDLGLNYSKYDKSFNIYSRSLAEYLANECGNGFANKKVPTFIKQLSPSLIEIFLDAFCVGDGYFKPDNSKKGYRRIFYTSSDYLANDIQELLFKAGYNATIQSRKMLGQVKWVKDHFAVSSKDAYMISESATDTAFSIRMENVKEKYYKGMVYCLSVPPTELLFTRRNGTCFWSGNSGVPDPVYIPLEGAMTSPGNKLVLIGNMTKNMGYFYDTHFHADISKDWYKIHWKSTESEIVHSSMPEYFARKYGVDSNVYRIRVLGEPPLQDENTLIPLWAAIQCVGQEFEVAEDEPLYLGVDVARYGDDSSIILPRRGLKIFPWETFRKLNTIDLGGFVNQTYQEMEASGVAIDVIGVGAGVADWLNKRNIVNLYEVNVTHASSDIEKYHRLRDELWCKVRDNCLLGKYSFPDDIVEGELDGRPETLGNMLANELASVRYSFNAHGGYVVESKKDMKARGIASPNIADALCLTEYFHNTSTRVFASPQERQEARNRFFSGQTSHGSTGWLGA